LELDDLTDDFDDSNQRPPSPKQIKKPNRAVVSAIVVMKYNFKF